MPVDGRFGCNQIGAARNACVAGAGFGQFLSYQVMPQVNDGSLKIVLKDFEPTPWPVSLMYPGSRLVTARMRVLIECLKLALPRRATLL